MYHNQYGPSNQYYYSPPPSHPPSRYGGPVPEAPPPPPSASTVIDASPDPEPIEPRPIAPVMPAYVAPHPDFVVHRPRGEYDDDYEDGGSYYDEDSEYEYYDEEGARYTRPPPSRGYSDSGRAKNQLVIVRSNRDREVVEYDPRRRRPSMHRDRHTYPAPVEVIRTSHEHIQHLVPRSSSRHRSRSSHSHRHRSRSRHRSSSHHRRSTSRHSHYSRRSGSRSRSRRSYEAELKEKEKKEKAKGTLKELDLMQERLKNIANNEAAIEALVSGGVQLDFNALAPKK